MSLHRRVALCALSLLVLAVPVAVAAKLPRTPETERLPPTASAGYLLGYPVPTFEWHGCTATATATTLFDRVPGAPPYTKGSRQRLVTFKVSSTAPYVTWQVKKGYTICGAEAAVVMANPRVDSELLGEIGYTSGRSRGATASDGRETIRVHIKKGAIGYSDFKKFEGKTFSIDYVQDVAVFVKRAR